MYFTDAPYTAQKATIPQVINSKMSIVKVITTCQPPVLMTWHFDYRLSASKGIIKGKGHQYQWLAGGYALEIDNF